MILLKQMMFERCSNDVLLSQNDVRTRANLGMALIIELKRFYRFGIKEILSLRSRMTV